jgi:hypothetical protein
VKVKAFFQVLNTRISPEYDPLGPPHHGATDHPYEPENQVADLYPLYTPVAKAGTTRAVVRSVVKRSEPVIGEDGKPVKNKAGKVVTETVEEVVEQEADVAYDAVAVFPEGRPITLYVEDRALYGQIQEGQIVALTLDLEPVSVARDARKPA